MEDAKDERKEMKNVGSVRVDMLDVGQLANRSGVGKKKRKQNGKAEYFQILRKIEAAVNG